MAPRVPALWAQGWSCRLRFRQLCGCCRQQGRAGNGPGYLTQRETELTSLRLLSFLQAVGAACFLHETRNIFSSMNISPLLFAVFWRGVVLCQPSRFKPELGNEARSAVLRRYKAEPAHGAGFC